MEKNSVEPKHIAECQNCGHTSVDDFQKLLKDGCNSCKSHAIVFVGTEEVE